MMKNKIYIYADHAATTRLSDAAFEAMLPFLKNEFGNASSLYSMSRSAKKALKEARETIADLIGAECDEIIFTSGGTESDNQALKGAWEAVREKGRHVVTSAIEHHAVLNACGWIAHNGGSVTEAPVDRRGIVSNEDFAAALRNDTVVASVMLANNEIGTIQDISSLAKIAHDRNVIFHTDAVQAVGHIPVNVKSLGVDLLSASAHKFNGPKGVGFLYVRKGVSIAPFMHGGAQESNMRAGTENVASIVGMATALKENVKHMDDNIRHLRMLESEFAGAICEAVPGIVINGTPGKGLPGLVSISLPGSSGESMLHRLDLKGIAVATGAACNSRETVTSHVLKATGMTNDFAHGTLRFSFGPENTIEEVSQIAACLRAIIG